MYAVSNLTVIAALFTWHRGRRSTGLPREPFVAAMRAGMRFVCNTRAVQAAMVRTACYSIPASAPWALLPLFVRRDLGLGPGMYGLILGMMTAFTTHYFGAQYQKTIAIGLLVLLLVIRPQGLFGNTRVRQV